MPKRSDIILGEKDLTDNIESRFKDEVEGLVARLGAGEGQVEIKEDWATINIPQYGYTLTMYRRASKITVTGPKDTADTSYQVGTDTLMRQTLLKILGNEGYRTPVL